MRTSGPVERTGCIDYELNYLKRNLEILHYSQIYIRLIG